MFHALTRRDFVHASLQALFAASIPASLLAAPKPKPTMRPDWDSFKLGAHYPSFLAAIRTMRANANAADRNSWAYWSDVHVNYCPHSIAYFLAWHRGYLLYFEQQLRTVSGNPGLMLPYWDYYKNATIPAEFTDPAAGNPLYVDRANNAVTEALTLAPFSDSVLNFQRGLPSAYEPSIESMPHNPVHNLIGGIMVTMQSPMDPIFWLHHANIDRLWNAWVAAGGGRTMPARSDAYWSGSFTYAPALTMARSKTINTRTDLGYYYQNEALPLALSGAAAATLALAPSLRPPPPRPPDGSFRLTGMRQTGTSRLSLGGAAQVGLDESSVSARLPLDARARAIIGSILEKRRASPFGQAPSAGVSDPYTSIQVVLDGALVTAAGLAGGYFYRVYLNLPSAQQAGDSEERYVLGTVGPFEVAGASHHHHDPGTMGSRLVFPATGLFRHLAAAGLEEASISFVRISSANSPRGNVLTVGECRLEVSDDPE